MISSYKAKVPFFTVVICTFNRDTLLQRSIASLLAQEERDWEAIIVDDGSEDNTSSYCNELCKQDARFKYIFHSHRGLPLSRNAGILAASGLFITFLDSDDEYLPHHLARRKVMLSENSEVDFLWGGVKIIGNPLVPDKDNPNEMIHLDECKIGGTFFVKKHKAIELEGFDDLKYADDADFYARAYDAGLVIASTQEPSYVYYRDTPDSICNTFNLE